MKKTMKPLRMFEGQLFSLWNIARVLLLARSGLGRWIRLVFAILLFAAGGVCSATASGVTVITHGAELLGAGYPAWVDEMAKAVTNAAAAKGFRSSWYHVTIYGDIFAGFQHVMSCRSTATAGETEEVVLTVDWSSLADHTQVFIGATDQSVGLNTF